MCTGGCLYTLLRGLKVGLLLGLKKRERGRGSAASDRVACGIVAISRNRGRPPLARSVSHATPKRPRGTTKQPAGLKARVPHLRRGGRKLRLQLTRQRSPL
ncbi:hypothetical protein MRX96_016592 [Rhipicephalus microplus]